MGHIFFFTKSNTQQYMRWLFHSLSLFLCLLFCSWSLSIMSLKKKKQFCFVNSVFLLFLSIHKSAISFITNFAQLQVLPFSFYFLRLMLSSLIYSIFFFFFMNRFETTHHSQTLEMIQMSINGWLNKNIPVYSHSEIY